MIKRTLLFWPGTHPVTAVGVAAAGRRRFVVRLQARRARRGSLTPKRPANPLLPRAVTGCVLITAIGCHIAFNSWSLYFS
jgi:hypothetical protein